MNNVEILVDYYLHITLYVSHALTSYTHITSNSLLSFVHEIECKLMWPSKIIHFVMFDAKFFEGWFKLCVLKNFWNHLHAFHVMKNLLKNDSAKKFWFFKKILFFRVSINRMCYLISRNFSRFSSLAFANFDLYPIDARSIEAEKFSVSKY